MIKSSFSRDIHGRLARVRKGVWAFCPGLLPPPAHINWGLSQKIADASTALGKLQGVLAISSANTFLSRYFKIRETAFSLALEGHNTTIRDIFISQLADDNETVASPQYNYLKSLKLGEEYLKNELPPGIGFIQELHQRFFAGARSKNGQPGEFRNGLPKNPEHQLPLAGFDYIPPPEPQLKVALYALDKFLRRQSELPPIIRACLIYYQFNALQPFSHGNGVIGRMLFALSLYMYRVSPFPALCQSEHIASNNAEYSKAFEEAALNGNFTPWLSVTLDGIGAQAEGLFRKSCNILKLKDKYHATMAAGRSSATIPDLVDSVFTHPALNVAKAAELMRVTFRAAQFSVDRLVEAGILREITGRRRGRIYVADEIIQLIE